MTDELFLSICTSVLTLGAIGYSVLAFILVRTTHQGQRDYYGWLKRQRSTPIQLSDFYTKADAERLQRRKEEG